MSDAPFVLESGFLKSLPPDVLQRLSKLFARYKYEAGTYIFREGQQVDCVYFLSSGQVALDMDVPGRERQRMLSLGPGDLLGWSPLLENAGMIASALALTNVELYGISAQALRDLCATEYDIGYFVMREFAQSLGRRLLATRLQLLDLFGNGQGLG